MLSIRILVLATVFAGLGFLISSDDGIGIDPNGGKSMTSLGDHRCTIDPNGAPCVAVEALDRGAGLDPDGLR